MPLKVVAAARAHDLCSDTAKYIPILYDLFCFVQGIGFGELL